MRYSSIALAMTLIAVSLCFMGCPKNPVLGISALGYDFGTGSGPWTFYIWNDTGNGSTLSFTVHADHVWIQLSIGGGSSSDPDDPAAIQVTINRAALQPGENTGQISIESNGGSAVINISATGEEAEGEPEGEGGEEGEVEGEGAEEGQVEGEGAEEGQIEGEGAEEGEQEGEGQEEGEAGPVLGISSRSHDFGTDSGPWTFFVWNDTTNGSTLAFAVYADQAWIQLSVVGGESDNPEDEVAIQVTINRAALPDLENFGHITIDSDGGMGEVDISALGDEAEGGEEGQVEGEGQEEGEGQAEGEGETEGQAGLDDDLIFIHHSVGQDWLDNSLNDALLAKDYIDERNDITYGTMMSADSGRPDSLGDVPGDNTDMHHWILWFNDYLQEVLSYDCGDGVNRIVMFKSCFPNSNVEPDETEPGDPFSDYHTIASYKALYRHPSGAGHTYAANETTYHPLEDIFASNPNTLFIPVTSPPLCYIPDTETNDANAHAMREFDNWLKSEWLTAYTTRTGLHNVAVFDLFNELAYADSHATHPNRLRAEYGGDSGDSHPNGDADAHLTAVFATNPVNFLDTAWAAFQAGR